MPRIQAVSADPKIVLFDLETLPNLPEAMKNFKGLSDYPGQTMKANINSIICFGYKIFGQMEKADCISAWDFDLWEKNQNNDFKVCQKAHEILSDADAIVTHNGKRFDWKFLQTRLLANGMTPLPKIPHVDTCAAARKNLFLTSNRLSTLSQFLGGDDKMDTGGWELWVKVLNRDVDAMRTMKDYCIKDVELLEDNFKKLRPFLSNLPNQNLWIVGGSKNLCPACGSSRLKSNGIRPTKTRTYRRYQCTDCGSTCNTDLTDRNPRSI